MFFGAVGAVVNDLCRRPSGDSIVELILDHGIKCVGDGGVFVVVGAALREDVGDLLPDPPFACADGADALQQLAEVIFAEGGLPLLEALVVHHKAFGDVLFQHPGGPDAKAGGLAGVDPVAHRYDGVEVVELGRAGDGAAAFGLNYFHFGNSSFSDKFAFLVNVGQVF